MQTVGNMSLIETRRLHKRSPNSSSRSNSGTTTTKQLNDKTEDYLPTLDIKKEDAQTLDQMTLFTHQFLKYGEKKNIIRKDANRLNQTIQNAKSFKIFGRSKKSEG